MPRPVHPVKVLLAARGETVAECALKVEVAPQTLSKVLGGHVGDWPALRRRLAQHLGAAESELFAGPDSSLREAALALVSRTDAAERLVDQAVEQGHPRHVTDPSVIGRTATLIQGGDAA